MGGTDIVQIFGYAAHIFGYGHIVIIEDNNKIGFQPGGIIQGFVGHPSRKGAVPDYGNNRVVLSLKISRLYHTQSGGYGSGAVTGVKAVTVAFLSLGEAAHASVFIGLMSHIPYYFIIRQIQ